MRPPKPSAADAIHVFDTIEYKRLYAQVRCDDATGLGRYYFAFASTLDELETVHRFTYEQIQAMKKILLHLHELAEYHSSCSYATVDDGYEDRDLHAEMRDAGICIYGSDSSASPDREV